MDIKEGDIVRIKDDAKSDLKGFKDSLNGTCLVLEKAIDAMTMKEKAVCYFGDELHVILDGDMLEVVSDIETELKAAAMKATMDNRA